MMAMFSRKNAAEKINPRFKYEQGAIVRGDPQAKKLALVFTGDEYADGAGVIADALQKQNVKASFFFTGRFYRNPAFKSAILRLRRDGHYLGAHSDAHLLYNDWNDRNKLLVSREEFEKDLTKNYAAMQKFGIAKRDAQFFLPPFEWFNRSISDWTAAFGLQLVNFSSGTGSNADYTTPAMKNYASSEAIFNKIKNYEAQDANGLNGFILLLHVGTDAGRTDKFYNRLHELIDFLKSKNYQMVRIEQLLR
jgi:peptidoglycan/xylan/chitin deacetylase (PgdA/CDA1 family)